LVQVHLSRGQRRGDSNRLFEPAHGWFRCAYWTFIVYAVFSLLFSFVVLNEWGMPRNRNGNYVLEAHGRVIRQISSTEYQRHTDYELRGADNGHAGDTTHITDHFGQLDIHLLQRFLHVLHVLAAVADQHLSLPQITA